MSHAKDWKRARPRQHGSQILNPYLPESAQIKKALFDHVNVA